MYVCMYVSMHLCICICMYMYAYMSGIIKISRLPYVCNEKNFTNYVEI